MSLKGRAQFIVLRDGMILAARHREHDGREYYVVPGGGIEEGETPDEAALRELKEEAGVDGRIVRKLCEYADPYDFHKMFFTYLVDIGDAEPSLGYDPEVEGEPILIGMDWVRFESLSEKDRAYWLSAGLLSLPEFVEELDTWSDEISYPRKKA